ncbi:MAG: ASKHA domain-containing protein [Peptococcaceae bacterium]|nr:ASKHA domain-containing protein [Peptococcaceae bacterium]
MQDSGKLNLILQERKTVDIDPDPLTRKIFLGLPEPGLTDNRADVDRVRQELIKILSDRVNIDLDIMRKIPRTVRESGWRATAVAGWFSWGWKLVDLQEGDTTARHFGLAVDIGTTTVVAYLVDMATGRVTDVRAGYNGQIKYGEDILSRIFSARDNEGLMQLRGAVTDTLNGLILGLAERNGLAAEEITAVSVGANTTMVHLFLGLDPRNICVAPYIPAVNSPGIIEAGHLGLMVNRKAPVYIFPGVGSYLGGDVVAGILASGMHRRDELALLVDIGTNGEIVMGNSQWMAGCAGAAGPALEGGVAACGMRAEPGAIYKVKIDRETGQAEYHTIGEGPPVGICGSGLVDSIAELFLAGMIDRSGRFRGGKNSFVLVPAGRSGTGKDIAVSQADINNFMRTKGAVNAALEHLLESVGCGLADIERFYAAGAFGHHLDIESAVTLGLYPDLPRDRMVKIGNSSGEGARIALMSRQCIREAEDIARNITYFELNASQEFMNRFVSSKFIPHTNLDYFPTVKRRMAERGILKE